MRYLPQTKWGDCSRCPSKDCACVKVGKDLVCIPCRRKEKGQEQVNKANERDKQRRKGNPQNGIKVSTSKLRSLSYSSPELKDAERKIQTKSQLLQQADKLFSEFIKRRDTKGGKVYCPCCKGHLVEGDANINCMHFIDRDVYLLRFDEDAAHAGHGNCNRNQHYNPSGKEYQNFKQYLIDKFGEVAVEEMELAKRKINKITEQQLKTIIEHYSQQ